MWFIYAVVHIFLLALVVYTDEHLATNNKLPKKSDIHTKVGSVLIMSTLMCFVGASLLFLFTRDFKLSSSVLILSAISAVTMVSYWGSYFYLLQEFPANKVGPLYQLGSIWLLVIELLFGGSITALGLTGILVLIYGAYILDAGTFKWQIPTKLLRVGAPATSLWAITLFLVRIASNDGSVVAIYFWQLVFTGVIGLFLLIFVSKYREGFVYRIKNQGKLFVGLSGLNETFSEVSYLFSALAVAIAPVAAYVSSMTGLQGIFLIIVMFLFPQGKRAKVNKMQVVAAGLIAIGVLLVSLKQ